MAPLHASIGIVQVDSVTATSAGAPAGSAVTVPAAAPAPATPPELPSGASVHPPAEPDRRSADLELRRLAAELAPMVDVWGRLLAQHMPDRAGRCQTCTKGGTGLPSVRWPCSIHGIADLARRCHERSA